MNLEDDSFLHVCEAIERELVKEYNANPRLTDSRCIYALDRAKIAIKHAFGYAVNESLHVENDLKSIVESCVSVAEEYVDKPNGPTLKELLARIEKVSRSVRRHSQDGNRGYYEFVHQFFK